MIKAEWFRGLRLQLAALLTVALLPLGGVALFQTNQVAAELDRNAGLALLGMTEQAAAAEQTLIERAIGVTKLLAVMAPDLSADDALCQQRLSQLTAETESYSFAAVLPLSAVVTCSSAPEPIDFTGNAAYAEVMAARELTIGVNPSAPASRQSIFFVTRPFFIDDTFAGAVSVSIPHNGVPRSTREMEELGLVDLITFDAEGEVLTARTELEAVAAELPQDRELANLYDQKSQTFRAQNLVGEERRYSVVTNDTSPASVMAIWSIDAVPGNFASRLVAPAVFPMLMWFASMGVAMLAIHSLVLRHLTRLRLNMDQFADDRQAIARPDGMTVVPFEIDELEKNFARMSTEIMRDEAELEDVLRTKNVLVKEIHHRVKNNLQLIASIMNLQIRSAEHHETKVVLRRVQDRVLSLATIHRDLYQSQDGGRVDVGALISEVIEKSVELIEMDTGDIDVVTDIDPVRLYPDQAVPLSLLVAEATTNAMKFIGDAADQEAAFCVALKQDGKACSLTVSNIIGSIAPQESTGLGSQLIKAFAMQLGGQIDTEHTADRYTLTLQFQMLDFQPEGRDF